MAAITQPMHVRLPARGLYAIPDVAGVRVVCERGSVWLTIDHDPRDIVLEAGDAFLQAGHGRALVSAFTAAHVRLAPADAKRDALAPASRRASGDWRATVAARTQAPA
jgi:hypothetical protein